MARRVWLTGTVAALLLVTACTSSDGGEGEETLTIRGQAEEMIGGGLADEAGLGDLTAVCPDVTVAVGATFQCTATTADQQIVNVDGVINDEGRIQLSTNNVITAAALPSFERAAVQALNDTVGSRLTDDAVDCGARSVIFGQDQVMVCGLEDPHTESTFDVTLTVADIEARQFSLVVADQPRP